MDEKRPLIKSVSLRNFLSFGSEEHTIELRNLNVLIGPNGSGKSNFIEALRLLKGMPTNVRDVILDGGGVAEWIWKGEPSAPAGISVLVEYPDSRGSLRHKVDFRVDNQAFYLDSEYIQNDSLDPSEFVYECWHGQATVGVKEDDQIKTDSSVLAQLKGPSSYPEITYLGEVYSKFSIYREWRFGGKSVFRIPQRADMPNSPLRDDFSNLGLFLNYLCLKPKVKATIIEALSELYEEFDNFEIRIEGGTVQVMFMEGDFVIPATRLSDGTLRYLCLLAILCDPEPPPLICIEEPELGLHPDVLLKLAELIIDASSRTQLVVTTHSDILVDALSEQPESIVVCEKHEGATRMERLDSDQLAKWLDKYRLGELWISGELGGMRW